MERDLKKKKKAEEAAKGLMYRPHNQTGPVLSYTPL